MSDVTQILSQIQAGNAHASDQLLPLVYQELRRLANQKMAQEAADHTLQPTALVHEAYMRLVSQDTAYTWQNRGHFYAAAAEAMRRILIESARQRKSYKRGGHRQQVDLSPEILANDSAPSDTLLALHAALEKFQVVDREAYQLVMLRYFGGLSIDEASQSLGISARTAKRHWTYARAWLQREVERQMEHGA